MHGRPAGMVLVAFALSATACDPGSGLRTPVPRPTPQAVVTILVDGPTAVSPGSSSQFHATAVDEAGARVDVTSQAAWSIRGDGLAVSPAGVVSATRDGIATVSASVAGSAPGEREVIAVGAGTYLLRGLITPIIGGAAGQVALSGGPLDGTTVNADAVGRYFLFGVSGAVRLRATMLGHDPQVRDLVVTDHLEASFAMTAPVVPDPTGQWRLSASTSAACAFQVRGATATLDVTSDGTVLSLRGPVASGPHVFTARLIATIFDGTFEVYPGNDVVEGILLSSPPAEIYGRAFGLARGDSITATLDGTLIDRSVTPPRECVAADHPFVMTRIR